MAKYTAKYARQRKEFEDARKRVLLATIIEPALKIVATKMERKREMYSDTKRGLLCRIGLHKLELVHTFLFDEPVGVFMCMRQCCDHWFHHVIEYGD